MNSMKVFYILAFVCINQLFCQSKINLFNGDGFSNLKAYAFEMGYRVNLIDGAHYAEVFNLRPHENLVWFWGYGAPGNFNDIVIQTEKMIKTGSKVVWFIGGNGYSVEDKSNDLLSEKFGFQIIKDENREDTPYFKGENLSHLWVGLNVQGNSYGIGSKIIVANKNIVVAKILNLNNADKITSVLCSIKNGSLLVIVIPNYVMFLDDINKADHKKAMMNIFQWITH